ncbi:hypothetical protein FRC06_011083 [Ceratobasidium sp. 370]|nr:hypothetical protein FRC06_011083 [Ceratobasidium sp. 370]
MPKDTVKDIQSLLREHGLTLRMKNGQLSLEERTGAGSGLPRKQRPIYIFVGPKPAGTPRRGEPDGYNLQEKTRMNNDDYTLVYNNAKIVLEHTHGIDTSRAITQQNPQAVDLAMERLVSIHCEMEPFTKFGYWAPCAFFLLILRNKSCKVNTQAKRVLAQVAHPEGAQQEVAQQEAEPAVKPQKKKGQPRKVKVPAPGGQPAIEGVPAVAAQPMLQGEPACDGVPVTQPIPTVIAQPAPAVTVQPVPVIAIQPVPAVAVQPIPAVVPAVAVQPVPATIAQPDDDVETIDIALDESDFDTTMISAAHDLSRLSIHANQIWGEPGGIIEDDKGEDGEDSEDSEDSEDEDDEDSGLFDMALATGQPLALPSKVPSCNSTPLLATCVPIPTASVDAAPDPPTALAASPAPAPKADAGAAPVPPPPSVSSTSPTTTAPPSSASLALCKQVTTLPALTTTSPFATIANALAPNALPARSKRMATAPFGSTAAAGLDLDVVWCGLAITPANMARIRSAAARQAEGGKPPRIAAMYRDLIDKFATNPEYNPSSEPLPIHDLPASPAPTTVQNRGRGRTVATSTAAPTAATTATTADLAITPPAPVDTPPVVENLKPQPKAKAKAKAKAKPKPKPKAKPKPKMKPAPEPKPKPKPEPKSESESEPVPESTSNDNHTADNATLGEKDTDGDVQMEVVGPDLATSKQGKANQQAAGRKVSVQATTSVTTKQGVSEATTTAPAPNAPAPGAPTARCRRKPAK